jgi:hypothetical protein
MGRPLLIFLWEFVQCAAFATSFSSYPFKTSLWKIASHHTFFTGLTPPKVGPPVKVDKASFPYAPDPELMRRHAKKDHLATYESSTFIKYFCLSVWTLLHWMLVVVRIIAGGLVFVQPSYRTGLDQHPEIEQFISQMQDMRVFLAWLPFFFLTRTLNWFAIINTLPQ